MRIDYGGIHLFFDCNRGRFHGSVFKKVCYERSYGLWACSLFPGRLITYEPVDGNPEVICDGEDLLNSKAFLILKAKRFTDVGLNRPDGVRQLLLCDMIIPKEVINIPFKNINIEFLHIYIPF